MSPDDIREGQAYTDGKGNVRLVLDFGEQYKLYAHQLDCTCLRYRVVAKVRGRLSLGEERNSTCESFARWAKAEAEPLRRRVRATGFTDGS